MNISTFLIKTLAAAGLHTLPDDVAAMSTDAAIQSFEPNTLEKLYRLDQPFTLAAHRSHSSHGSHRSHRSSSGGSTPPYSPPSTGGAYSKPKPAPVVPSPDTRNSDSTPPSSVLPSSPSISAETQKKLKGSNKDFKWLTYRVQTALYGYGFYTGAIDGFIGPQTKAAITNFERSRGLPVTGTISDALLDALNISIN